MIHASIPDVSDLSDASGSKYEAFNIYLNGAYHASIRYSNLLRLHETIKRLYGNTLNLPDFPPKKLMLSEKALEERKAQLQRYIQSVIQHPITCNHAAVMKFFLEAQVESFRPTTSNITVDVFCCDGRKSTVKCDVSSSTSALLEKYADSIDLKSTSRIYFGLFIVDDVKMKDCSIIRWLRDFESPYISLQNLNKARGKTHQMLLRRCYWDLTIETRLITSDDVATELIFTNAVQDVSSALVSVTPEVLQRLKSLQKAASVKEYLKVCALQTSYGYWRLDPCVSDYPNQDTRIELKIGRRQLVIRYSDVCNTEPVESVFKATRIRVWKIVNQKMKSFSMRFEFEYLMARDHYEWIVFYTNQAVLLSQCLQSMGAEILRETTSQTSPQTATISKVATVSLKRQNNSNGQSTSSNGVASASHRVTASERRDTADASGSRSDKRSCDSGYGDIKSGARYESLTDVLTTRPSSSHSARHNTSVLANDAFNTITDDDL